VGSAGGVVFVHALSGLGTPHWRADARGIITGITRGTTDEHLAYATLEGIAWAVADITQSMEKDLKQRLRYLKVDGGACANNLLMQMQADFSRTKIIRPEIIESTALGAAFLAGMAVGVWKDQADIQKVWKEDRAFNPKMSRTIYESKQKTWKATVQKA